MSTTAVPLREAIRRTLAHRDPETRVDDATVVAFRQVGAQLAPVIGAGGVDALLRRSLVLTSTAFPWLASVAREGDSDALLAGLGARLADHATGVAAEAGCALLVTFVELLASLIGEPLTERLLRTVWAPASTASTQESTR